MAEVFGFDDKKDPPFVVDDEDVDVAERLAVRATQPEVAEVPPVFTDVQFRVLSEDLGDLLLKPGTAPRGRFAQVGLEFLRGSVKTVRGQLLVQDFK